MKLVWFIALWPFWTTATIVVALTYPAARMWLIVPLLFATVAVSWRIGMLVERYVRPRMLAHRDRPWVPLRAVINDVAYAIEAAQESPASRWLWMGGQGEPQIDWVKVAEVAVDAAARSAYRRRRDAAVRRMMEG